MSLDQNEVLQNLIKQRKELEGYHKTSRDNWKGETTIPQTDWGY